MRGAHVLIRHVRPSDYAELHRIESDPTTATTWRYRGELPPLEDEAEEDEEEGEG